MWGSNKLLFTFLNLWARKLFLVFAQKLGEKIKFSKKCNCVLVWLQEKAGKIIEFFVCVGFNNCFCFLVYRRQNFFKARPNLQDQKSFPRIFHSKSFFGLDKKVWQRMHASFFSERLLYNKEEAKKLWTQIICLKKKKVFTSFCFFLSLIKMLFLLTL